jgi:hypothetical protein
LGQHAEQNGKRRILFKGELAVAEVKWGMCLAIGPMGSLTPFGHPLAAAFAAAVVVLAAHPSSFEPFAVGVVVVL